jgi:hypothetical protein
MVIGVDALETLLVGVVILAICANSLCNYPQQSEEGNIDQEVKEIPDM